MPAPAYETTKDPEAVAKFIVGRFGPISCHFEEGDARRTRIHWTVIAHLIRDGVPVDYVGKGTHTTDAKP